MATELILDTVQGASLDAGPLGGRHVRGGLVKGIDVSGTADSLVLDKALAAVLAVVPWRDPYPSGDGSALSRVFVYPAGIDICRVQLIYEPNTFPVTSAYLLRDASYMQQWQGTHMPGNGQKFSTQWKETEQDYVDANGGSPPEDWEPDEVPSDYVVMSFPFPVRALSITAIVFGTPPANLQSAIGMVNDSEWSGLKKGYWLITHLESDVAKFSGYYTFTATASTRNYQDWSETGVMKNKDTGRYVTVDQATIDELRNRDYAYGVMQGGTGAAAGTRGIIRVCPYPETSFWAVFGF